MRKARLAEMIEEATVDAYDEAEQATGWFTVLESHVVVPFTTTVLGAEATVTRLELRGSGQIVAICERGRDQQAIGLLDLGLASPKPDGFEWIEAYRQWLGGM
jgi:hypothetical protein